MNIDQLSSKKEVMVKLVFGAHDPRTPIIGKFIDFQDSKDLERKNMVRFIDQSRLDFYTPEKPSIALSRIYVVSDFSQVIIL